MILASLAGLAEREGLIRPAYELKEVHWRVTITADGRFVGFESLLNEPASGRPGRLQGRRMWVPRPHPGAKLTGTTPSAPFLVANVSFLCGVDLTEEQKYSRREGELDRRMEEYQGLIIDGADETEDDGLLAVRGFIGTGTELIRLRDAIADRGEDGELQSHHLIAICLSGVSVDYVHMRDAVAKWWRERCEQLSESGALAQCLVTGEVTRVTDKHPPIKKVPSGSSSGISVVSFNEKAFESYGLVRNENAPVSRDIANAYTAALNRLLDSETPDPEEPTRLLPEQRIKLTNNTIAVFWSDAPSPVPSAIVPTLRDGEMAVAARLGVALPEGFDVWLENDGLGGNDKNAKLREVYQTPWAGIRPEHLEDQGSMRMLVLRGARGRATIQAFHTSQIVDVVRSIRRWFEDLRLATFRGKPAIKRLLASLAVRGETERLAPDLAGKLFLAAVAGRPLPLGVLHAAVARSRTGTSDPKARGSGAWRVPPDRAALVKVWLNRNRARLCREGIEYQEVRETMNQDERNHGYLLGRMFACIERMQELALGPDVGSTVTDRYFGSACATPQAVFPRLLKTEVHHFRKAREGHAGGTAVWLHRQVSDIASLLVGQSNGMNEGETIDAFLARNAGRPVRGLPAFLPLPEQGLFTLGYHQQRAEFFRRRDPADRADAKNDES